MIRGILLVFAALWGLQAFAVVVPQSFIWERSGRFFLTMTVDGNPVELRGNVRIGETADARSGAVAAQVKSYAPTSPVISVIVSSDANDVANLILVQADGDGDTKKLMTNVGIPDRKATAQLDLEFILNGLKQRKSWDALASFKWIVDASSGKQLFQLADKVEVASDSDFAVVKPLPRTASGQGETVRTPQIPRDARGMNPNVLTDNGAYPPAPPLPGQAGQPTDITPDGQQQQADGRPRRPSSYNRGNGYPPGYYPQPQYDGGGYPPPPEMQGRLYPQQQQQQGQSQPRYRQQPPRGYGQQQNGYYGDNGYPPPPPQQQWGGQGFFPNIFGRQGF